MKKTLLVSNMLFVGIIPAQAQQLEGIWRAIDVRDEGRSLGQEVLQDLTLTVWRDRYLMSMPDGTVAMNMKVGTDAAGRTIELKPLLGVNRGKAFRGRYELSTDELLLAYAAVGSAAPESLDRAGPGVRTVRWKRVQTPHQGIADKQIKNSIGMELRLVLPGTFVMGSAPHEPRRLDEAQHRVTISGPFYIGKYEVTVVEYRKFAAERTVPGTKGGVTTRIDGINRFDPNASWDNPGFPQSDRHPAVDISWEDANEFCQWLSQKEGKTYRLPTEAEWEYAARAGSQTAFWWGDDPKGAATRANIADQSYAKRFPARDSKLGVDDKQVFTAQVGSYSPNGFGLHDVIAMLSSGFKTGTGYRVCSHNAILRDLQKESTVWPVAGVGLIHLRSPGPHSASARTHPFAFQEWGFALCCRSINSDTGCCSSCSASQLSLGAPRSWVSYSLEQLKRRASRIPLISAAQEKGLGSVGSPRIYAEFEPSQCRRRIAWRLLMAAITSANRNITRGSSMTLSPRNIVERTTRSRTVLA